MRSHSLLFHILLCAALLVCGASFGATSRAAQGCPPEWVPTFGALPGTNGSVHAFVEFDDGSGGGPALYAGGTFTSACGKVANRVAKWDGESWSELGSGLNHNVWALAVFDDGSGGGPALYAGGEFTSAGGQSANRIAKWDGASWSALGSGMNSTVYSLAVFDGAGGGPALYAGGGFTTAGGQSAGRIAKWNGASWSTLASGMNNLVQALTVFDDGSGAGPALYAGGSFTVAGGQSANAIAKWNGLGWSAFGGGTNDEVIALSVFDDGSGGGPALYAGGSFIGAGPIVAGRIARWDGASWSALGSGMNDSVRSLAVFDDGAGAGPALYAGGTFTTAGGVSASRIARWDGQSWSALGSGFNIGTVRALRAFGPALYAGGSFSTAGGQAASFLATWDGQVWEALADGFEDEVIALAVFDDGSSGGPALYAGGSFIAIGSLTAMHVAKWDGQGWSTLSSGLLGGFSDRVRALTVFDDGSGRGPALYAAGTFTSVGGVSASNIARWDGEGWSALGTGIDGDVRTLAVFDDGSGAGPALYAGGSFLSAGGQSASRIAKWDGQSWSALGSGTTSSVHVLAVHDDGSGAGPALYAGGSFSIAGGQGADRIAKWDGQSWSALGSGMDFSVDALTVFDDGSGVGPVLVAGGGFTSAGAVVANHIAKWDGQSWSSLGTGMDGFVQALEVYDDGTGAGPALYAGGFFTTAGGQSASRIAKWDGQSWSALGSVMSSGVSVFEEFDDGSGLGSALYAGGSFDSSSFGDSFLAKWGCPPIDTLPGCFGNPAALASSSSAASIGSTFDASLSASELESGLALLYFGVDGTRAGGCGLFVSGLGELLLALGPGPLQVGSASLSAGAAEFLLPVPSDPGIVAAEVALQGVAVGLFDPGIPIELSDALLVRITQ